MGTMLPERFPLTTTLMLSTMTISSQYTNPTGIRPGDGFSPHLKVCLFFFPLSQMLNLE